LRDECPGVLAAFIADCVVRCDRYLPAMSARSGLQLFEACDADRTLSDCRPN